MRLAKALLWLDLETTGSDPDFDEILEIGAVLTRNDLTEVASFEAVLALDDHGRTRLDANEVVRKMHDANGLRVACEASTSSISTVGHDLSAFLAGPARELGGGERRWLMLAGSGVQHFDRAFLDANFKWLDAVLAYPCLDVGVFRRFCYLTDRGDLVPPLPADGKPHRALADARLHLSEARTYVALLCVVP